jgi:A118 family predicted phage portal protein
MIFTKIWTWIKEVFKKMFTQTDVQKTMGVEIAINTDMAAALTRWYNMYHDQPSWKSDTVIPIGLPASIAAEIARMTTIEMSVTVDGGARATYLQAQLNKVISKLREQIEEGCAVGGMMVKPYPEGEKIAVDFVPAGSFYPVSFDGDGEITAVIFVDQRVIGKWYYTRFEYHNFGEVYTIRNVAYKSQTKDTLGNKISLGEVADWADLEPEVTINDVTVPLYGYFRFPLKNNIDPNSPLGVSCFHRAESLIRQADEQWARFLWEFESGERALYADPTAFDQDKDGKPILPKHNRRLYRTLEAASGTNISAPKLFEAWTPEFRDQPLVQGLDVILKRIEDNVGLARGTFSDPQTVEKTATEIKISRQRTYTTVTDTQKAIRTMIEQLVAAMSVYADLYRLAPRGGYELTFEFDDSVITDKDSQAANDRQSVSMGVMPKYQFLMRNYGLSEEAAKAWIAEVQGEAAENDLFGDEQGV